MTNKNASNVRFCWSSWKQILIKYQKVSERERERKREKDKESKKWCCAPLQVSDLLRFTLVACLSIFGLWSYKREKYFDLTLKKRPWAYWSIDQSFRIISFGSLFDKLYWIFFSFCFHCSSALLFYINVLRSPCLLLSSSSSFFSSPSSYHYSSSLLLIITISMVVIIIIVFKWLHCKRQSQVCAYQNGFRHFCWPSSLVQKNFQIWVTNALSLISFVNYLIKSNNAWLTLKIGHDYNPRSTNQ